MSRNSIVFEKIHVDRALGIGRVDGFTVDGLVAGVNLIHGPNGSGKSTLARVIHELIWPGRTGLERPTASGLLQIDDDHWNIDIDAGQLQPIHSTGGRDGNVPSFGPPELRSRYHLPLHELIVEQDFAFAKAVADACQGGFDIDAAAKSLGFSPNPSSSRKVAKPLADAVTSRLKASQNQRNIDTTARTLNELCGRQAEASLASREIVTLEQAVEYHKAVSERDRLQSLLADFPQEIGLLNGNEKIELVRLDGEDSDQNQKLIQQKIRLDSANTTITESKLGQVGVEKLVFDELELFLDSLVRVEGKLGDESKNLSTALAEANRRGKCLSSTLSEEELEAFNVIEFPDLTEIARKSHRCNAERMVLELKRNWLASSDATQFDFKPDEAQEGIVALSNWLSSSKGETITSRQPMVLIWIAISIIGILTLALITFHHWAWILAAAGAGAIAFMASRRGNHDVSDASEVYRQSFEHTALPPLTHWTSDEVAKRLIALNRSLAIQTLSHEKTQQRKGLEPEENDARRHKKVLDKEIEDVEKRLGMQIDIENNWLPIFVENLSRWQNATSNAVQLDGSVAGLQRERSKKLASINTVLTRYGYAAAEDSESAKAHINDLRRRIDDWNKATGELDDANKRIKNEITPDMDSILVQRDVIFERLNIRPEESEKIDAWLERLPEHIDLGKQFSGAEAVVIDRKRTLVNHDELLELTLQECEAQIVEKKSLADTLGEITEEIAEIKADIGKAKKNFEMTDAIAAEVAARDKLIAARDRRASSVVGDVLTKWVKKETLDKSRPDVFRRAKSLLATITHGNLRLVLDDHAVPPVFLAASHGGRERPVAELSIGERVQLLLAVRLAFLEQDEIVKLPLLLDETLGTSDDQRVELIIETVMEIARDGRQVFYFTAQHDEVGKWVASLERAGVPYQVIDLAKERSLKAAKSQPLSIAEIKRPDVPSPDSHTYAQYGQALDVAEIDPTNENIGRIHLWHFLSDEDELYLLLCKGIETWGQLETLMDCVDQPIMGLSEAGVLRARAAAKAIDTACRAWRIGRSKPIDREVLMESGIISEAFLDQVTTLAEELNDDAGELLESLANKKIKAWRQNNNEPLREFFESRGYLTLEEPIENDEVRIRTMAAVGEETEKGLLDQAWLDLLVHRLPR